MRRIEIYIVIVLIIILAGLFAYLFVFKIYEVTYTVNPESLFADNQSVITLSAEAVNSFGWKILFRKVPAYFQIKEGKNLVNIVFEDDERGILKLKAKDKVGTVIVYVRTRYALLPSSIAIQI